MLLLPKEKPLIEVPKFTPIWGIRRYENDKAYEAREEYSRSIIHGNRLLNEGITELLLLLIGASTGSPLGPAAPEAFSNGNARLGVGNGTAAESATQASLQGASRTFKSMEASYPQVSAQTVTFRSVFGSADANFSWQEFTVINGADETLTENLNRKVSNQEAKASGQTWTLDLQITIS